MQTLTATWLGRLHYAPAFALQRALADRRAAGEIGDVMLLLEHEPVYTLGRRAAEHEVLLDQAGLAARGIEVERSDRGGLVTYHGPGQLVGYPIVDLETAMDLVEYVRALERALIATAGPYGVEATTVDGLPGVWVGREKLAAIGVHVSRGITTHGFALNVTTDLTAFNGIVPCGIVDRGVTSIGALTGTSPDLQEVAGRAAGCLARELRRDVLIASPAQLGIEVPARV